MPDRAAVAGRAHAAAGQLLAGVELALVARPAARDTRAAPLGVQRLRMARGARLPLGHAGGVLRLGGRPRAGALVAGGALALADLLAGVLLGVARAAVLLGGGLGQPMVEGGDARVAGEARDLAGVLLVAVSVTVGAGQRLRLGIVHLAGVTLQAVGRAESARRVARVARSRHRGDVHAGVARRARVAVVSGLGDCIDTVVTVLAGRRRRGLPAVVRVAARIDDRDAGLVAIEARLAVAGGAVVRQGAVRERYRVALVAAAVEMAVLAARRAGRRKRRGVLAGDVAGPARVAGHAHAAGVTRDAGGVGDGEAAVVVAGHDAPRRALVLPGFRGVRRRCGERQRRRRAGAQQHEDGDGHERVLTPTCHSPHLPTALKADPSWTLVAPGGHQANTDQTMNTVRCSSSGRCSTDDRRGQRGSTTGP